MKSKNVLRMRRAKGNVGQWGLDKVLALFGS